MSERDYQKPMLLKEGRLLEKDIIAVVRGVCLGIGFYNKENFKHIYTACQDRAEKGNAGISIELADKSPEDIGREGDVSGMYFDLVNDSVPHKGIYGYMRNGYRMQNLIIRPLTCDSEARIAESEEVLLKLARVSTLIGARLGVNEIDTEPVKEMRRVGPGKIGS